MKLENEFTVPASVSEVWKTLLDVQRIAPCIPGATLDRIEGDEIAGRVKVRVGPIAVSYAGTARFVRKDEAAHRFVLKASGRETRGTGTAAAAVEATMSEQGSDTRVTVTTELDITGKQAQFGRGVMADVAAKLTDQFAACLAAQVSGPSPGVSWTPGSTAEAPATTSARAEERTTEERTRAQTSDSLDLVRTVAVPMAKQFAPVMVSLTLGLVLGMLLGRRRRRAAIVIASTPQRALLWLPQAPV